MGNLVTPFSCFFFFFLIGPAIDPNESIDGHRLATFFLVYFFFSVLCPNPSLPDLFLFLNVFFSPTHKDRLADRPFTRVFPFFSEFLFSVFPHVAVFPRNQPFPDTFALFLHQPAQRFTVA